MFPNILKFIGTETAPEWLQYAVVLNGFLQATNNQIGYYSSVEILSEDGKQLDVIEKKIFSREDVEQLKNAARVDYRADGFKIYFEDGSTQFREWTGEISENRELSLYDDMLECMVHQSDFKKFPDLAAVVPATAQNGQIDVKRVQTRATHFRAVMLSPEILTASAEAFNFKDPTKPYLRLELFHTDASVEKKETPTKAILVTPIMSKYKTYTEAAVIMPILK